MLFLYRYFDNHSIFRGIIVWKTVKILKGFFSKDNRAIIEDFEGVVSVTEESIGEYTDTVIKGTALRHLSALGRPG